MGKGWAQKRLIVLSRDGYICWLCGQGGADSVDHVIPHSKGGTDGYENLKAAHMKCNDRKRAKVGNVNPRVSRFG